MYTHFEIYRTKFRPVKFKMKPILKARIIALVFANLAEFIIEGNTARLIITISPRLFEMYPLFFFEFRKMISFMPYIDGTGSIIIVTNATYSLKSLHDTIFIEKGVIDFWNLPK